MKVRPRSALYDAVRWWPDCDNPDVCHGVDGREVGCQTRIPHIHDVGGITLIAPGDWIVTSAIGSKQVIDPICFEQSFEEA